MKKEKNLYLEMKERQQKEVNDLPIYFAFGDEQMKQKADLLGFKSIDEMIKNVSGIGGGGFCLKKDLQKVIDTFKKHAEEMEKALKENDIFLQQAFEYELANHEYIITYDIYDTLRALPISIKEYTDNQRMQDIMAIAIENYKKDMEKFGW